MITPDRLATSRSATAALRGYLYQAWVATERWLDLAPDEQVLLEGREDLDFIKRGGELLLTQVKDLSAAIGSGSQQFQKIVADFVRSYLELRDETPQIRFTFLSTAPQAASRGRKGVDLLEQWRNEDWAGVARGLPALLRPVLEERTEDLDEDGWVDFAQRVQWVFDEPRIGALRDRVVEALTRRFSWTSGLEEQFTDLLYCTVLQRSCDPVPRNRLIDQDLLLGTLKQHRDRIREWDRGPMGVCVRGWRRLVETVTEALGEDRLQRMRLILDEGTRAPSASAETSATRARSDVAPSGPSTS